MDYGDGAQQKVGNVGEDGDAASGDEVGCEELVELGEGIVNAHGGGEVVAVRGETGVFVRVANTRVSVEIEYGRVSRWAARFTGNAGTMIILCI